MKKFLALALALVMALALAVPAMAFTNDVAAEYEYTLGVELVEYENDAFFGIVGAAPSDRGYAKNEIVAFIVSYTAQKGGNATEYDYLKVTGKNVTFDVTENDKNVASNVEGKLLKKYVKEDALGVNGLGIDAAKLAKADQTVKYLAFAKVTGDDASITAEVTAAAGTAAAAKWANNSISFTDDDGAVYAVNYLAQWKRFTVQKDASLIFAIDVDKNSKSTGLFVYEPVVASSTDQAQYEVVVKDGDLAFARVGAVDYKVLSDKTNDTYKKLKAIVDDEFEGVFGFDYDLLGGLVTEKYFESIVDYDKLSVTVDIAPWVAYVQVPDVIVVDPPKTGDATVLVGIVMAIVAAAGVVVFNKVRA